MRTNARHGAWLGTAAMTMLLPLAAAAATVPAETGIEGIRGDLAAHRYKATEVVRHYQARIARYDQGSSGLHSVLELNPDAPALAATVDAGKGQGPLNGVAVLLKDNIDTADRMHTTAGSLALMDTRPAQDAFVVRRLRQAGAVILGKTNLSEWANFRSVRSSSGWSGRGGQTHNPYALDRNPCGSSSGSGAAVAADLATVAVGSETDGSIVCPSSVNGIVGIKPTLGLVSRSGIIPISPQQDTAGPMARSVADAAILLTVMAGYDPDDPATAPLRDRPAVDYTAALKRGALKGARIGVVRKFAGFHDGVDGVFARALDTLRAQGAIIVDLVEIPNADKLDTDEQLAMLYEYKDSLDRYLAGRHGSVGSIADLINFNLLKAGLEMPYFGQELLLQAQTKGGLDSAEYKAARERAKRLAGAEGIDAALAHDKLDALIAPTVGPAWTTDLVNGDHFLGGGISTPPAVAGYPHISVPMGAVHDLPVGLSIVGPAWSEARLIGYAYDFEQASHSRVPPPCCRR